MEISILIFLSNKIKIFNKVHSNKKRGQKIKWEREGETFIRKRFKRFKIKTRTKSTPPMMTIQYSLFFQYKLISIFTISIHVLKINEVC